ncbi:MAG: hypothetical protein ACE5HC_16310, partial [Candidatus Binatia bacterium]
MTDQTLNPMLAFAAGILATFIGFVLREVWKTIKRRKSVATAILAEATSARDRYMRLFGNHLEQTADSDLPSQRATFREYGILPVFDAQLGDLGIFPKEDAGCLARVYTEATGFVQTLRNFLAKMDRLDEIDRQISLTTIDNAQGGLLQLERSNLIENQLN